jgi:hypothetical protein
VYSVKAIIKSASSILPEKKFLKIDRIFDNFLYSQGDFGLKAVFLAMYNSDICEGLRIFTRYRQV